ncbi:MAG: hypothetical protein C4330_00045 [Chitinophagaceae bacterium]
MYIVSQQLLDGCGSFAVDTVFVRFDSTCWVLGNNVINFRGALNKNKALLNWTSVNNNNLSSFILERSKDGINFSLSIPLKIYWNKNHRGIHLLTI